MNHEQLTLPLDTNTGRLRACCYESHAQLYINLTQAPARTRNKKVPCIIWYNDAGYIEEDHLDVLGHAPEVQLQRLLMPTPLMFIKNVCIQIPTGRETLDEFNIDFSKTDSEGGCVTVDGTFDETACTRVWHFG